MLGTVDDVVDDVALETVEDVVEFVTVVAVVVVAGTLRRYC